MAKKYIYADFRLIFTFFLHLRDIFLLRSSKYFFPNNERIIITSKFLVSQSSLQQINDTD